MDGGDKMDLVSILSHCLSGHTIHFKFSPLLTKKGYEKEGIRPLVLFCFANSFLS
jgi:hypothetical protein